MFTYICDLFRYLLFESNIFDWICDIYYSHQRYHLRESNYIYIEEPLLKVASIWIEGKTNSNINIFNWIRDVINLVRYNP